MPIIVLKYRKILFLIIIIILITTAILSIKWIGTLLYPLHYSEYIKMYSVKYGVDPLLIAAMIKVESRYYKDAESHKGARGLMQITPNTGKWISEQIVIEDYHSDLLYEPEVNIMMGCWYVSNLKKQFNNNIKLVLAAYNGGSGNVEKWLNNISYSIDGESLQDIPFDETKKYVEKVYKNYRMYKTLYDEEDF